MPAASADNERTSYIHGVEADFLKAYPEQLLPEDLLNLISQADRDVADFLAERYTRDDIKGRTQEITSRLADFVTVTRVLTGRSTFEGIVHSKDVHTPTERIRINRSRQEVASPSAHSPPLRIH